MNQLPQEMPEESKMQVALRKAKIIAVTPMFLEVFFGTWLCFVITVVLFTYGYMNHSTLCWAWMATVLFFIILAVSWHLFARPGQKIVPLSTGCFIALLLGTILGLYNYDTAAIFPMFYHHSRKYTNVVSSEPSAAVADAGKIVFNRDTRVVVEKSAGYTREDGTIYCVAPIMDPSNQPRIEYWAAGIGCCEQTGHFDCDQSTNTLAQGGVVVFDNNAWFAPARYPFYQKARAKAEAQYGIQSVGEPLFVRWVEKDNLDMLENMYGNRAMVTIIIFLFLWMIMSAALSFAMWQPRSLMPQ
jgi:hypothetical protein